MSINCSNPSPSSEQICLSKKKNSNASVSLPKCICATESSSIRSSKKRAPACVALLLCGCNKFGHGGGAGTTGDYVSGTPLPERREGTSFFGGNVRRGQFSPIYFDFDSQTIRSPETGKIQEIANFMKQGSREIIIAGFTDERGTAEYNHGFGDR